MNVFSGGMDVCSTFWTAAASSLHPLSLPLRLSVTSGTIFGVYLADRSMSARENALQPGNKLVAGGYCLYSSSTVRPAPVPLVHLEVIHACCVFRVEMRVLCCPRFSTPPAGGRWSLLFPCRWQAFIQMSRTELLLVLRARVGGGYPLSRRPLHAGLEAKLLGEFLQA